MQELKLIRWAKDGFPPIDLNANISSVTELIREVERLRKESSRLQEDELMPALSPAKQEWVSGRWPENPGEYLCYNYDKDSQFVCYWDGTVWGYLTSIKPTVNLWMPLPALPSTEEK